MLRPPGESPNSAWGVLSYKDVVYAERSAQSILNEAIIVSPINVRLGAGKKDVEVPYGPEYDVNSRRGGL